MPTYFPQVRNGIISQRPYSSTSSLLHSTNDLESGSRISYSWRTNPLGKFDISWTSIGTDDLSVIESFFHTMAGKYGEFVFLDPSGNLVPHSEIFADGSADPFGGIRAGHTTGFSQVVLPAGGAQGITLCTSVWCKATSSGQSVDIGLTNSHGSVSIPAGSWKRISYTSQVPDNNPVTAFASTSSSILMFGAQCVAMPGPGGYSKTPEGLGLHPHCRFDVDKLTIKYVDYQQCSVQFTIAEFVA
jgi:hypothetical protein